MSETQRPDVIVVGGGIGGLIQSALAGGGAEGLDLGAIVQSVAGGGVGGAVLLAIVGAVKMAVAR